MASDGPSKSVLKRHVLILGSSNVNFSRDGTPLDRLLEATLNASPDEWKVTAEIVGQGRAMADTMVALAKERQPDVLVVALAAAAFTYEFVVNRIRRRWPVLYRPALAISQALKWVSGGDSDDKSTVRGLLYRVPEAVAMRLIGGETSIAVEHAIENTTQALEALASLEETPLVVRLPVGGMRATPARAARYEQRLSQFRSAITEVCRSRLIPVIDVAGELRGSGTRAGHGFDGIHLDERTRRVEAELLAREVLAAAGVPRDATGR